MFKAKVPPPLSQAATGCTPHCLLASVNQYHSRQLSSLTRPKLHNSAGQQHPQHSCCRCRCCNRAESLQVSSLQLVKRSGGMMAALDMHPANDRQVNRHAQWVCAHTTQAASSSQYSCRGTAACKAMSTHASIISVPILETRPTRMTYAANQDGTDIKACAWIQRAVAHPDGLSRTQQSPSASRYSWLAPRCATAMVQLHMASPTQRAHTR